MKLQSMRRTVVLVAAALWLGVSISPGEAATIWQPGATSMWYEATRPQAEAQEFTATTTLGEKEPVVVALWAEEELGPVRLTVDFRSALNDVLSKETLWEFPSGCGRASRTMPWLAMRIRQLPVLTLHGG